MNDEQTICPECDEGYIAAPNGLKAECSNCGGTGLVVGERRARTLDEIIDQNSSGLMYAPLSVGQAIDKTTLVPAILALIHRREQEAFKRGRIAEAKTCEQERRHNSTHAVRAALERVRDNSSGGGSWRRVIEQELARLDGGRR